MVVYNFKRIRPVPSASDFIDVVLTRTQRKTPTVVHPGYQISRIREFYMRKVKFTQETFNTKLSELIEDFPRLDEIHPFYADLVNVLYDRDHYKLALGQLNTCRHLIENLAKDYVRMLKYGDSLYRCKQVKRACLGRMCTLIKKHKASLAYLEEVRKHLSRLPAIDPNTRSILLCGYPNVGKSSFMNKLTRANVDVQPYAFTTKSLFVGHMDYKYLRWQVLDTPGILDHPLEQRNTIEMQAVTALAHLNCCVLYFLDLSQQCGFTVQQQAKLFRTIKPLFASKPLFLVANKIDVVKMSDLDDDDRKVVEDLVNDAGVELMEMSTVTNEGVMDVKVAACDKLLEHRVRTKMNSRRIAHVKNRLHVARPKPGRSRKASGIPESVLRARAAKKSARMTGDDETVVDPDNIIEDDPKKKRKNRHKMKHATRRRVDDPHAWGTVFNYRGPDLTKQYDLKNDAWKTDAVPEIMDGKNIADFVDADILKRLDALEKEEEALLERAAMESDSGSDIDEDASELAKRIRDKRAVVIKRHRREKTRNTSVVPKKFRLRTKSDLKRHLDALGVESEDATRRRGRKRVRSLSRPRRAGDDEMDVEDGGPAKRTRSRSRSMVPKKPHEQGLNSVAAQRKVAKLVRVSQRGRNRDARKGPGDRVILNMMPKHLYSGKRGIGSTDRR